VNSFPAPMRRCKYHHGLFESSHAQSHRCSVVDQWLLLLLDVMVLWLARQCEEGDEEMKGRKEEGRMTIKMYWIT